MTPIGGGGRGRPGRGRRQLAAQKIRADRPSRSCCAGPVSASKWSMGYSRSSPRGALAAALRARAGGVMLSAVPACTSSGQETREANLIGRLNATPSAVRAHTSLRQLGPAIGAYACSAPCLAMIAREPGSPITGTRCGGRPRQPSNRITQAVSGYAEQMEDAGVAGKLREHRHTVHRRGHRHSLPRCGRPRRRRGRRDRRRRRSPTARCAQDRRRAAAGRRRLPRDSPGAGVTPTPAGGAIHPTRRNRGSRTAPRQIQRRRNPPRRPPSRRCPGCSRNPVPSPHTAARPRRRTHRRSRAKCQAAQRSWPLLKLISSITSVPSSSAV